MSPFVCFILKMSLSCLFFVCLVMVYDVWQQYFFCFILLVGSIQIENCFGNCQKSRQKKWDLLLLFDLIWVEDILMSRVHNNFINRGNCKSHFRNHNFETDFIPNILKVYFHMKVTAYIKIIFDCCSYKGMENGFQQNIFIEKSYK